MSKHTFRIVWVVRMDGQWCLFDSFAGALDDWRSHAGFWRWLYPKLITTRRYESLEEFTGW